MPFDNTHNGRRVRLVYTSDIYTDLQPGDCGTVSFIDNVGTVHVHWDKGNHLGLVQMAGDRFEWVD